VIVLIAPDTEPRQGTALPGLRRSGQGLQEVRHDRLVALAVRRHQNRVAVEKLPALLIRIGPDQIDEVGDPHARIMPRRDRHRRSLA
jgi:hypothetical protein